MFSGPTVSVIILSNGRKIGGFARNAWNGDPDGEWISSGSNDDSFLFSLTNQHKYHSRQSSYHQRSFLEGGVQFGNGDLSMEQDMTTGSSDLGNTYSCRVGSQGSTVCRQDFSGSYNSFTFSEVQVFTSVLYSGAERAAMVGWGVPSNFLWRPCYRATKHGWNFGTSRSRCSSDVVIIVVMDNGKRIGGYVSTGITGNTGYRTSSTTFLFSLTNMYKHTLIGSTSNSFYIQTSAKYLAFGGGHDFYFYLEDRDGGACNIGHTYSCRVGAYGSTECRNDFCGSYSSWTLAEVEIYN